MNEKGNVGFYDVKYEATFGMTGKEPSRYRIVQLNPASEEVIGILEEPGSKISGHYKSFEAALANLGELIYLGRHAGHRGPSYLTETINPDRGR